MSAEDPIATAERRLRDYGGYLDLYPARALLAAAKSWRDRALAAEITGGADNARIDALESAARADAQLFRFHLRQIAALERRCRWTGLALAFSLSFNLLVVYALWSAYVAAS